MLTQTKKECHEILAKRQLMWLQLDMEFPYEKMYQEAKKLRALYIPHKPSTDGKFKGWGTINLHGISAGHVRSFRWYKYKKESDAPYHWTGISNQCPVTKAFIKRHIGNKSTRYNRIMYMLVEKEGGKVGAHWDREKPPFRLGLQSFSDTAYYLNLVLNWPKGCRFVVDGRELPLKRGMAFIFDSHFTHEVFNDSNIDRYVLNVCADFEGVAEWEKLIVRSFRKYGTKCLNLKKGSKT